MRVKYHPQETPACPQPNQPRHAKNVSDELESRFQNALEDNSKREQQEKIKKKNQQQQNADKSHSDKEADPSLSNASENLYTEINNKQKLAAANLNHRQSKKIIDEKVQKRDSDQTDKTNVTKSRVALEDVNQKMHKAHVRPELEVKTELPTSNLNHSTTQGDMILKSLEAQTPKKAARDINELIGQLVDKIYVSLPKANEKEVRLLLHEGLLKGGEISIKQDGSSYSVLIKQEHAHSLISQNARIELSERLLRFGIEHPVRITVSEQMHQQHDQQHSRQQRNIYDEWNPEDE